jgi:hypothetical protein
MRFILASEDRAIPLLLTAAPERAESDTKLLDLPAVFRPIPGALRGDGAVVVPLRLAKEIGVRP